MRDPAAKAPSRAEPDHLLPGAEVPIGYAWLALRFGQVDPPLACTSYVRSGTRQIERGPDGVLRIGYPRAYHPGDTALDHLQFALKHEGIELGLLRAVLAALPADTLTAAIAARPTSMPLRRLWFLYEWLLDRALDLPDLSQGNYVPLFDPERYVTGPAHNSRRHRVRFNGLGARAAFCPVVRRTPEIDRQIAASEALATQARQTLDAMPSAILWRATAWLFDQETRSSYAIERERPQAGRVERFVQMLRRADRGEPMSRALLVAVQNAIVDPAFAERDLRTVQNWVGRTRHDFTEEVFLIPPTPAALPDLLDAWIDLAHRLTGADAGAVPPIVAAAVLSFAFVYLHPFEDGNGRLHRWLIHWALARRRFGPPGVVLPVSAVIVRDPLAYDQVLDGISRSIRARAGHDFVGEALTVAHDHADLFRHLDLTPHAEVLHRWLDRTINQEIADEVRFLARHDLAIEQMRAVIELPDRRERLFLQLVVRNGGRLAQRKRAQFPELSDAQVAALEAAVWQAFGPSLDDLGP